MSDPIKLPVEEGYDRWSQVYDTDGNPLLLLEEPVVKAWLGDVSGLRIADIGCGTGRYTSWLAASGARVVGAAGGGGICVGCDADRGGELPPASQHQRHRSAVAAVPGA